MADKKTCNFPDCNADVRSKGLCSKHYQQTKSPTPAIRTEARKYAIDGRTPRVTKPKPVEQLQTPLKHTPQTPSKSAAEKNRSSTDPVTDAARGAAHDAFVMMGGKSINIPQRDGNLYVMPKDFRAVWVGPDGHMQEAHIYIGDNKERLI